MAPTAVIGRAELICGDILAGQENLVLDVLRSLHIWAERIHHADERDLEIRRIRHQRRGMTLSNWSTDLLYTVRILPYILANELVDGLSFLLRSQLDEKVARIDPEK